MSTALGMDLQSAALQVGKALNDPRQGVAALSRAGIQFSNVQKANIRQMVEMGDVAEIKESSGRSWRSSSAASPRQWRERRPARGPWP
jgi:hypothetical protein